MKINELKTGRRELFADAITGKLTEEFVKDEYMCSEPFIINDEMVYIFSEYPLYQKLFCVIFGEFGVDTRTGKVYSLSVINNLVEANDWNGGDDDCSGGYELALTESEINSILNGGNPEDAKVDYPEDDGAMRVNIVGQDAIIYSCDVTELDELEGRI